MAEPVSSGVGAAALVKLYGLITILAVAAFLSYLIVVMTREPRSRKEWVISLVTTLVGSIAGGSLVVQRFGLHEWSSNWFGMCALGGIIFCCGLPFWAIVRWTFNYINTHEGSTIIDVFKEVKKEVKGGNEE
ncbi:hypothetical protein [Acinetobacter beijerinckii]|uniref:hypothetical protein n=1 Tax=Acinetobacter beijerinckii TaxID=262668 RepID=UPI003AF9F267